MALFKKKYPYYVVYKYKKENGDVGTGSSLVVLNGKVKTIYNVHFLQDVIFDLDKELENIVIVNWVLLK